ncbi:MAG: TIR domain-containing protein, partial [Chlorobiaceae bacterium]
MGRGKRVFISYSRSDGSQSAEKVIALLAENNISSWRDISDMKGEHDNWQEVKQAIEDAQHLVLMLTPAALKSEWVKKEWSYARQEGVRVSPILIANIEKSLLPLWQQRGQLYGIEDIESRNLLVRVLQGEGAVKKVSYDSGELPEGFVPRPEEYYGIKDALLNHQGEPIAITAALRGAGGYGKTVLADALCRDEDIRFAFSDGVIRIVIGKDPQNLIGLIVDIIEKIKGVRPGFQDLGVATEELSKAIGDGYLLLVIDDVWHAQHLRPFMRPNKNCVRLITTRIDHVLPRMAKRFNVDQLTPAQSYHLLSRDLVVHNDFTVQNALRDITKKVGYWAQMLAIANRWVWERTIGAGYTVTEALDKFSEQLTRKGLTSFDPDSENERDRAVRICIEASIEDLQAEKLQRFQELAIFPEDEEIPVELVQILWYETGQYCSIDSDEYCQKLYNRSLLLNYSGIEKSIKLHDNMLFYLREKVGSNKLCALQETFVLALSRRFSGNWASIPKGNHYLWKRLTWHLRKAGRRIDADRLLIDYNWIKAKLDATGAQNLYAEYRPEPEARSAQMVGRSLALSLEALSRNKAELPVQLYGRLYHRSFSDNILDLAKLISDAKKEQQHLLLYLKRPSLTIPGAERIRLKGHESLVMSAKFSANGSRILTASLDMTARVWDSHSGIELLCLIGHESSVRSAVYSPDGLRILTASADNTARIWDSEDGTELLCLNGHDNSVWSAVYSPDGSRILTASADNTAMVWDSLSGSKLFCLKGHKRSVWSAVFSPDGSRILTASWDKTVRIWDSQSGSKLLCLKGHERSVLSAVFSPMGSHILTASSDKTVRVWDSQSGIELLCLKGHESSVQSAVFSPTGSRILTASADRTIRIWDSQSGSELNCLKGHESSVQSAEFSPDGLCILTASDDKTARVWDAQSENEINFLNGHESSVRSAVYSPDGLQILTASSDQTARIWDAQSGSELNCLKGHKNSVQSAVFSSDGSRILTASFDSTVRVWDSQSGTEIFRLKEGHDEQVWSSAVFSQDGSRILTASWDKTARIWDSRSGSEILCLKGHEEAVQSAVFSQDGSRILTASWDKTARIWDSQSGSELLC